MAETAICGSSSPHAPHMYEDGFTEEYVPGTRKKIKVPVRKACPGLGPDRPNPLKKKK